MSASLEPERCAVSSDVVGGAVVGHLAADDRPATTSDRPAPSSETMEMFQLTTPEGGEAALDELVGKTESLVQL